MDDFMPERIPKKEVNTIAFITSSDEIAFHGELAEKYDAKFRQAKNDILNTELSPSYAFIANMHFYGYAPDSFQKTEFIEY
jgi:hypothetical protein